ncbi:MAG: class II aldolase/adducin family protein [Thermotogaceae bacterium]|nr:class II aldolase/adducin family protein [Thermotogaceae bacterium]
MSARIVLEAAKYISKTDLVKGTWGNVSYRGENKVWITPSGVPYDEMTENDIAVVDLDSGEWMAGNFKPSSELPMHLAIYRKCPEIKAVVHFHAVYSSAFSAFTGDVPCYTEDQAQIIGGRIRITEYAYPGTEELAKNVVEALKDRFGAIIANHGAVAIGRSMKEAIAAAEVLEKSCQIAWLAGKNGRELSEDDIVRLRKLYLDSYSKKIAKDR